MCNSNCADCQAKSKGVTSLEEYRKYRSKVGIQHAIVNLTDQCNLRCPYCFTCHNERKATMDVLKGVVDFLIKEGERVGYPKQSEKSIAFFGGEPMLMYDSLIVPFIHWIEDSGIAKEYHFTFSITTNGTLLNEERIKFLWGHNVGILLSIDGAKETQDNQRPAVGGKSSFDLIEPNIESLLKYFPETTFRSTIEPWNVDKILDNYMYAREKGFHHYFVTPNVYSTWTKEDCDMLNAQIAGIVMVMYQDIKLGGQVTWCDFFIDDLIRSIQKNVEITTTDISRCGLGTVSMGVGVDGTINGCQEHNTYQQDDIFNIGNIFSGIDEEKHLALLKAYQEYENPINPESQEKCSDCPAKSSCGKNFCPSSNLGSGGNVLAMPEVTCNWKKFFSVFCPAFLQQVKEENNYNAVKAFMERLG